MENGFKGFLWNNEELTKGFTGKVREQRPRRVSPITHTQVLRQPRGGFRGDVKGISRRSRVNGYACGKWPPFPNLGRNLFPSAEVLSD
jgi:hypothetical protein